MPFQIRYSPRALAEYESILDYLILNFGLARTIEIDAYFDNVIRQISLTPKMYPLFDTKRKIRRSVISKQTTLYYRISGKYIELISFRGNFMNPDEINL
jgi:plasmid stabilization system protein ParE